MCRMIKMLHDQICGVFLEKIKTDYAEHKVKKKPIPKDK